MIPGSRASLFGASVEVDLYWANVVLLQNFDGNMNDLKGGKTVTAAGNAQYSTALQKFGAGSCLCDGTGDYLSLADSVDWNMGAGDFTVEGWFYFNAWNTYNPLINQMTAAANTSFIENELYSSGTRWNAAYYYGSAVDAPSSAVAAISLGGWVYFASNRVGNTATWVYGTSGATTVMGTKTVTGHTYNDSSAALEIGGLTASSYWLNGNIGGTRITKGVGRDISQVPTAKFPTA